MHKDEKNATDSLLVFTFNDIPAVDDHALQHALRSVNYRTLICALASEDAPVREKIFNNLSKRTTARLTRALESAEASSREKTEAARMRIIKALEESGWEAAEGGFTFPQKPSGFQKESIKDRKKSLKDRIEDACAENDGFLSIYPYQLSIDSDVTEEELRSALESFANRRADLARIRTLGVNARHLSVLLEFLDSPGIEYLNLRFDCNRDYHLPLLETMIGVKELRISGTGPIPESIGGLKNLTDLFVNVDELTALPESIGNLQSLTKFSLYLKDDLTVLSESAGGVLKNLTYLSISGPVSSGGLDCIGNLRSLTELSLWRCKGSKALPDSIGNLEKLRKLTINYSSFEQLPQSIGNLSSLVNFSLCANKNLTGLPDSIGNLKNLESLHIGDSPYLERIPESLSSLQSLKVLSLSWNKNLQALPENIGSLKKLKYLDVSYSASLKRLPDSIVHAASLETVDVSGTAIDSVPPSVASLKGFTGKKRLAVIPREASVSYRSFVNHYFQLLETTARISEHARQEGLLALEGHIEDLEDDLFKQGIRLVVDGADFEDIRRILHLKTEREDDVYRKKLMLIAAEAVLGIQEACATPLLIFRLNFMVDLKDNPVDTAWEKYRYGDEDAFDALDFSAMIQMEGEREELRFIKRAMEMSETSRREGLRALENHLCEGAEHDVFERGLFLIVDSDLDSGFNNYPEYEIRAVLDKMIERETDPVQKNISAAKKEAILSIVRGDNPRIMVTKLAAFFHQSIADEVMREYLKD